jgi:hypothetical protein
MAMTEAPIRTEASAARDSKFFIFLSVFHKIHGVKTTSSRSAVQPAADQHKAKRTFIANRLHPAQPSDPALSARPVAVIATDKPFGSRRVDR